LILQMQKMDMLRSCGENGYIALENVAVKLARKDVGAAVQWALQLPEGLRDSALYYVAHACADKDPAAAAQLALQMIGQNSVSEYIETEIGGFRKPTEDEIRMGERNRALSDVVERWARKDLDAAMEWAEQLPAETSETALRAIVKSQVAVMIEDGANLGETLAAIAELPADLQPAAVEQLVVAWKRESSDQSMRADLANWIKQQQSGAIKDNIIDRYCLCDVNMDDLPFAMELACQIENNENRAKQIRNVFKDWLRWDHRAARRWLDNSLLPDNVKADLLKQPE